MPNVGRPSLACETCRTRRVKCDYTRPGCLRCERLGRVCPGYRDLSDWVFKNHTQTSLGAFYKGTAPNPVAEVTRGGHDLASTDNAARGAARSGIPDASFAVTHIPPALSDPWEPHIVPLILSQFSFQQRNGVTAYGALECFPTLVSRAEEDSPLMLASRAVGSVYFANRAGASFDRTEHGVSYGKALRAVSKATQDPVSQLDDRTLLAIWLLSLYECLLGTHGLDMVTRPGPENWDIHTQALVDILHLRGPRQLASRTGCSLFFLAFNTIQTRVLQKCDDPPFETAGWFEMMAASGLSTAVPFVCVFDFGYQASLICSRIRRVVLAEPPLQSTVLSIWAAIDEFTSRTQGYFERVCITDDEDALVLHDMATRNNIDAMHLRVQFCVLELVSYCYTFYTSSVENSRLQQIANALQLLQRQYAAIQSSRQKADRILRTLPYLLAIDPLHGPLATSLPQSANRQPNWSDALRIMWPLRLLAASTVVLDIHRQVAGEALKRIAYEMGIMQAVGTNFTTLSRLKRN
ncbi:hypothetical protein ASPZODRAFT_2070938 [Penicilliopsis zonata CBS 506.65]|uniref:Zn(2)-C6 fungal-type domain-containing protein n=1 Tax=Penicilliopsis zonata CBS 506.65 TaxID=1073090 RepID=A0A1L9SGC2_9EURO|nr:hypothetical protein ASPZODRAFT_2070938 [Penicilliopsis zonata CBS 506.65]OJJ46178.1 hypothetical protein ASPZODRAFT_2070938 [Penicilliopsis zonata CBS 506.65]